MLRLEMLVKTYKTGDQALKAVDLTVPEGQVLALIGPSGAGKSTLIRCINRLVEPEEVVSLVAELYRNEAMAGETVFIHGGLRLGSKG